MRRVALFIDGANIYAAARYLGIDIDYKNLLNYFSTGCVFVRAYYYTAVRQADEERTIQPMLDWLMYNGYVVVTKFTKEFENEGRRKIKGNMDMEMCVDMLAMMPRIDHVYLFTGDGDFKCVVAAMQQQGVRVTVVSTINTDPPMVADELRRQADDFMDLKELTILHRKHRSSN